MTSFFMVLIPSQISDWKYPNLFDFFSKEKVLWDIRTTVSNIIIPRCYDEDLTECPKCWELNYLEWSVCNSCYYSWELSEQIMEEHLLEEVYDRIREESHSEESYFKINHPRSYNYANLSSVNEDKLMKMFSEKLSFYPDLSNIWPSWAEIFLFCSDGSEKYQVKINIFYEIRIEKSFSDFEDEWTKLVRNSKIIDLSISSWNFFKKLNLSSKNEKVLKQYLVHEILNDYRYNSHLSAA